MCLICVEWLKGNLTNEEAKRALGEMVRSADSAEEQDHYADLAEEIDQEEEKQWKS